MSRQTVMRSASALWTVLGMAVVVHAAPLGTAFTYQGRLNDSGAPASGTYDLQCSLWDAAGVGNPPVGGNQIGTTQCVDSVAVVNGLFTVPVDFGAQFDGNARWLEIGVRADTTIGNCGAGSYMPLSPRQALTAAPNAVFALNASMSTAATNAAQLNGQAAAFYLNAGNLNAGTLPDARLTGTYSGVLSLSNAANSFSGSGAGLTALNASNIATGTLDPARLPIPLSLTSTIGLNGIINGFNASNLGYGVSGIATAPSGVTYGGRFQSQSTGGRGVFGQATAASGVTYGGRFQSDSTDGRGAFGLAAATTGTTYGGYFESDSSDGRGVYGYAPAASGDAYGVFGQSNSTNGRGVYGEATGGTGNTYGVYGLSTSQSGTGVYGGASNIGGITYGVRGFSNSTSGRGVYGEAITLSGVNYGVYGRSNSSEGTAVFGSAPGGGTGVYGISDGGSGVEGRANAASGFGNGVFGSSNSTAGSGVHGLAAAFTGTTYGGQFQSDSTSGRGVYGYASRSSGSAYGVHGQSNSTSGIGVLGGASATSGLTYGVYGQSSSTAGIGVYGLASNVNGGNYGVFGESHSLFGYGVYGQSYGGSPAWGVYSSGDFGASGTKSFRIDHPDDPENQYLLHYAAESPEVINFYRGTVLLDAAGEAVVELPPYFAKINKTPSYQLTAVGAPMPMLHLAEEISEEALIAGAKAGPGEAAPVCSFRIAGGVAREKVCWRVEALRNDRWVQKHGAPVEVEKQGLEMGTYQHPELYGLPAEMGMDYDRERERPSAPTLTDGTPR